MMQVKKFFFASLLSVMSSAACADANSCMKGMAQMKPTDSSSLEESLAWVRAARSAARCMGFSEMNDLLDEMETSIQVQKDRRKRGPQHPCKIVPMRTVTGNTKPKYPYVDWFDAAALLWNRPKYDPKSGELIGYEQTLLISMRPDYSEVGMDSMVYIGAASENGVTYLTPTGWQNKPTPTPCRPPESLKAEEIRKENQALANSMTARLGNLDGLPNGLSQQLSGLKGFMEGHDPRKTARKHGSSHQSNMRLCTEEEMVKDTLPSPYADYPRPGSSGMPPVITASIYGGFAPISGRPSWCKSDGNMRVYIGYGVLTEQAKKEISQSLALPPKIIASMESMVQRLRSQANTPEKLSLLKQISEQIRAIKIRSDRMRRKFQMGILRKTAIYRDGYDKQKCWEVARYYCPAETDDF